MHRGEAVRERTRGGPYRVALSGLGLLACSSVLGVEHLPRGSARFTYAEPTCDACVETRCGAQESACARDAPCRSLGECAARCKIDDLDCRGACDEKHPATISEPIARSLDACRRLECVDACFGVGGFVHAHASEACTTCSAASCGTEVRRCIQSGKDLPNARIGQCERAVRCMTRGEPNNDQVLTCVAEAQDALPELLALRQCLEPGLCDACLIGEDFSCQNRYRWRGAQEPGAELKLRLRIREGAGAPRAPIEVSTCTALGCSLSPPCALAPPRKTDAQGDVEVAAPITQPDGFTGCIWLTGEGYVPMLVQYDRPIVRSERDLYIGLITREQADQLEAFIGVAPDYTRGQVEVTTEDCTAFFAPGLEYRSDPSARVFYANAEKGLVERPPTSSTSLAYIVNLPIGKEPVANVIARSQKLGRDVARAGVRLVPGAITRISLVPDPE